MNQLVSDDLERSPHRYRFNPSQIKLLGFFAFSLSIKNYSAGRSRSSGLRPDKTGVSSWEDYHSERNGSSIFHKWILFEPNPSRLLESCMGCRVLAHFDRNITQQAHSILSV